jgi:nucleoside 2-deoxyribosyltransferase
MSGKSVTQPMKIYLAGPDVFLLAAAHFAASTNRASD